MTVCENVRSQSCLWKCTWTHSSDLHSHTHVCNWLQMESSRDNTHPSQPFFFFFWNSWWWIELAQKTTRVLSLQVSLRIVSFLFTSSCLGVLVCFQPRQSRSRWLLYQSFVPRFFCFLFFGVGGGCFILFKYSVTVEPHFWDLALKIVWILS